MWTALRVPRCFDNVYSVMMGGEGEIVRDPFPGLSPQEWPWDFFAILNHRRSVDAIEREIAYHPNLPSPSEATKRSGNGMRLWRQWVKLTEERLRKKEGSNKEAWEAAFIPGAVMVFDHKSSGNLAWSDVVTGEIIEKNKIGNLRSG